MNKTAIKNYAVWAREKLIRDVCYRAQLVGITESGIQEPLPASDKTTEFYDIGTGTPYILSGERALRQRRNLAAAIRRRAHDSDYPAAYRCIMEEVAYTWFNRLIAVRFMEVNDYLPSRMRALSSESGKVEPDLVSRPFDADFNFTREEEAEILRLREENRTDELFRLLFVKQCNALSKILPALFEGAEDYTELLLNLSVVDQDGVVWRLTHDIPEEDFNVSMGGQVEIIGWLYQYYNTEPKAKVFARPSGQKIKKEEIPAATQLFTPHWIVKYMVENSLGRLWLEGHPDNELREGWRYYIDEAEQEPEVQRQLDEIRQERRKLKPEEIKIIDPCMGSGHILVYAFDVLMQIYEKAGWERREAVRSIVENNLHGLDIDKRAWQLAYLSIMMVARGYDRRFLSRGIQPRVYYPGFDMDELEEYGSLVFVDKWEQPKDYQTSFDDAANQYRYLLSQKYHVVITNPPYMSAANMNERLGNYIKKFFANYKADYFSTFIVRCSQIALPTGILGFFSPYVWMFIQSYEDLRHFICQQRTIETLIQFEYSAFQEATVPVCTFVFSNYHISKRGCYFRLTDFRGGMEVQRQKTLDAISNHNCGYYFEKSAANFARIPGSPIAYWVSNNFYLAYKQPKLRDIGFARSGLQTGNNDLYLKYWHEVSHINIAFGMTNKADYLKSSKRWAPQIKGGEYRKWYGNFDYVVNWENDGAAIRKCKGCRLNAMCNDSLFFKEGITWSHTTSGVFGARFLPYGHLFNVEAPTYFNNKSERFYVLAYLNSSVAQLYLNGINATMHYLVGNISALPIYLKSEETIDALVKDNIDNCKVDWDAFETSWDFTRHPLVRGVPTVAEAFAQWETECADRFQQLKANEEELNRIFIDIYGLQDELTPEVEDKDVTVRRADLARDIRSLLSYAVGCMFGRYSLDAEGLIYAGGDWDEVYQRDFLCTHEGERILTHDGEEITVSKGPYAELKQKDEWIDLSFKVNENNIIPLTDEPYLESDIITRFCDWLCAAYAPEKLEENLAFIAQALGNKGATPRETIRAYFLKEFYANHCKIYQKRPIYWLFDSGKQNGFKALIYLHRYDEDTVGRLRLEYLQPVMRIYASEIDRMQDVIDNSANKREVVNAAKRREKLQKQLKECREYDEKIGYLALARISLDLDDGVKVNYEKLQTADRKYPVLGKI